MYKDSSRKLLPGISEPESSPRKRGRNTDGIVARRGNQIRRNGSSPLASGEDFSSTFLPHHEIKDKHRRRKKKMRIRLEWHMCLRKLDRHLPAITTTLLVVVCIVTFMSTAFWPSVTSGRVSWYGGQGRKASDLVNVDFLDVFPSKSTPHISFRTPSTLTLSHSGHHSERKDYGGLMIRMFETKRNNNLNARVIYHDENEDRGYDDLVLFKEGEEMDDVDYYYKFDDDVQRNPLIGWQDDTIQNEKHCRRLSWHRDLPINCNNVHEFDIQHRFLGGDTKYIGAGAYREVYLSKLPIETVVFKAYYWGSPFDESDFEYMRMDAIVAEKLTFSDKIVDLYGYCGTGMIAQAMENGDIESTVSPLSHYHVVPKTEAGTRLIVENELTGTQKLQYALEMAEALAVLHSFPGGVIVHDDIKLGQFLLTDDGNVRLNDFNRAEIMLWNEKDQEYCKYKNGEGNGGWRSREEYMDLPLDEGIDVWSMGNNLYATMTGLKPFYHEEKVKDFKQLIIQNKTAFIDPRFSNRSFGDSKLAELIPQCWRPDPTDRIDIFSVVDFLRDAVAEDKRRRNGNGKQHVSRKEKT